jgi:cytochrome c oxidase cbb3-type subunit 3
LIGPDSQTASLSSNSTTKSPAHFERGRKIYNFRCYFCHGYSGNAKTLAASFMNPRPRDFVDTSPDTLSRSAMIKAVHDGRPGTAMKSFANILSQEDIEQVVDFVRQEFMRDKAVNTRYHTAANGWPNQKQYAPAFPFALGKIPLDTPDDDLTPEQLAGKRIFMQSCVTCHDRARVKKEGAIWDLQAVSYPRNQYSNQQEPDQQGKGEQKQKEAVDSETGASPFAPHDKAPELPHASPQVKEGERLFQANCAFCHAADGTGKNWIGTFLQPHPRNLTHPVNMQGRMTREHLRQVIRNGLPGTTMSAWKSVLNQEQIDSIIDYINAVFHPVKG